jgi:ribosomal protein S18 acetylase RimI-like enzyme
LSGIHAVAIVLRPARPDDLPALLALEAGFPGDRLSRRSLRRFLAGTGTADAVVAEDLGRPVGYALVLRRRNSSVARLYSLIVARELRGQGLGFRLTVAAMVAAREAGCDRLRLEVRADNAKAIALYRQAGFREIGRQPDYYEDGEAAVRFETRMEAP